MRILIALGGNALLRRGEPVGLAVQQRNVARAARAVAQVAKSHEVTITHGNGPQVGLLALQSEASVDVSPFPLDVLSAESEGMIGYLLEQALRAELPGREIATLLTQVEVCGDDPAFERPTKPIGPIYSETEGRRRAGERGWQLTRDRDGLRRVVPSPSPHRILELPTLARLVGAGVLVICAGGGGIPVARVGDRLCGVEAVVDKDHTAALLGRELGVDFLLLLTDVPGIFSDWPQAQQVLRRATPAQVKALELDPGSMGPKAAAAADFAGSTGGIAAIGALGEALDILAGTAGTHVIPAQTSRRINP